ncbi:hypothetical protein FEM03_03940 [Phragmitibacter flavus]|uniref:Uncharacterized protein n=1 Tax=Phragmitibacter flavus TaxID=2576071 RepID=A0A5R8KHT4_9BACT|nr:hypothetical protein [Phragmitibacter flavus]TLD71886.1 hypothetical protein FEM03_03940 [Phragmitibacter flavus]
MTESTPAFRISADVQWALMRIRKDGGNLKSVSIHDLGKHLNLEMMKSEARSDPAARIELFGNRGPKRGTEQVLMITKNQITEDRRTESGRYVVWDASGKITLTWENEEDIRTLFVQNNMELPNAGIWKQPDLIDLRESALRDAPASKENPQPEAPSHKNNTISPPQSSAKPTLVVPAVTKQAVEEKADSIWPWIAGGILLLLAAGFTLKRRS